MGRPLTLHTANDIVSMPPQEHLLDATIQSASIIWNTRTLPGDWLF